MARGNAVFYVAGGLALSPDDVGELPFVSEPPRVLGQAFAPAGSSCPLNPIEHPEQEVSEEHDFRGQRGIVEVDFSMARRILEHADRSPE